jgi:hypothetical protein
VGENESDKLGVSFDCGAYSFLIISMVGNYSTLGYGMLLYQPPSFDPKAIAMVLSIKAFYLIHYQYSTN